MSIPPPRRVDAAQCDETATARMNLVTSVAFEPGLTLTARYDQSGTVQTLTLDIPDGSTSLVLHRALAEALASGMERLKEQWRETFATCFECGSAYIRGVACCPCGTDRTEDAGPEI